MVLGADRHSFVASAHLPAVSGERFALVARLYQKRFDNTYRCKAVIPKLKSMVVDLIVLMERITTTGGVLEIRVPLESFTDSWIFFLLLSKTSSTTTYYCSSYLVSIVLLLSIIWLSEFVLPLLTSTHIRLLHIRYLSSSARFWLIPPHISIIFAFQSTIVFSFYSRKVLRLSQTWTTFRFRVRCSGYHALSRVDEINCK